MSIQPFPPALPWRISSNVQLGPLERQMLELIWSRGNVTVRELLANGKVRQAYTTIMTTLDRLFKKGLLDRATDGKAFRYSARCSPEEASRVVVVRDLQRWIASREDSSIPHLSYFVEAISAHDARLLDELWKLVERKRQDLKDQESP
jgi:predicted transcriptional regulator